MFHHPSHLNPFSCRQHRAASLFWSLLYYTFQSPSLFARCHTTVVFADSLPCNNSHFLVHVSCLSNYTNSLGAGQMASVSFVFTPSPMVPSTVCVAQECSECSLAGWLPEGPNHIHVERTEPNLPSNRLQPSASSTGSALISKGPAVHLFSRFILLGDLADQSPSPPPSGT